MNLTFDTIADLVDIFVCVFAETRTNLGKSVKTRRRVEIIRVRADDVYLDNEKRTVSLRPFEVRAGHLHRFVLTDGPILVRDHGRFVGLYAVRLSMDDAKACLREHGNLRLNENSVVVLAL